MIYDLFAFKNSISESRIGVSLCNNIKDSNNER